MNRNQSRFWNRKAARKSKVTNTIKVQRVVLKAIFRGMDLSVKCFRYSPYTMRNAIADAMGAKTTASQRKIRTIIIPPGHRHL